jgi:putative membrane protein
MVAGAAEAHVAGALATERDGPDLSALLVAGVPMLIAAVLYGVGVVRLGDRATRSSRSRLLRAVSFYAGLAVLALALFSPLDRWAAELFSAHMVQHELIMLAAAPLLVLGRPLPVFLWGFNDASRAAVANFFKRGALQTTWGALHGAGCAWVLHALALWVWHVPRFFNAAVVDRFTHDLQHLTFLATALLFWSSLFEARRATRQGAAIVYLFTTTIHTGILGALIALATRPWYAEFLQPATAWQLTALEDQQLGGLIMWVPGSIVYVGTALVLFARWIRDSERPAGITAQSGRTPDSASAGQSGSTGAVIFSDSETPESFNRARQDAGSSPCSSLPLGVSRMK